MVRNTHTIQVSTWADFDDFWCELRSSHQGQQTSYAFDAFDEEVARIAFKAGRESMRRQVAAMLDHLLEVRGPANFANIVQRGPDAREVALRELADDVGTLCRSGEN